ncbi:hypothetical protein [Companilactobacillus ginsenosidimutans]|uniref:hypothetical protein n=1 Tax=Companilactobacillus ginsenosidimutans TaxID=1007676 RepID=UPI0006612EDA|nr:hypothetical protein [Companilactobacillus ginsenosidimutans]
MKAIISMDLSDVPIVPDDVTVFTVLNKANKKWADKHKGVGIHFTKIPAYVKTGDKVVNTFVQKVLHIKDVVEYENMLHFVYFSHLVSHYISNKNFDKILFQNQDLCEKVLLQFNNNEKYIDKVEIL